MLYSSDNNFGSNFLDNAKNLLSCGWSKALDVFSDQTRQRHAKRGQSSPFPYMFPYITPEGIRMTA